MDDTLPILSPPIPSPPIPSPPIPSPATIHPWIDPVVDGRGHDPRGAYAEAYWLSVIGPTAAWIMRRMADRFDVEPDGFVLDLDRTAASMGLSFSKGANSPFGRALNRCVMFGLARPATDGFVVRRRLPSVAQRHLRRLPADLQADHEDWARRLVRIDRAEIERRLVAAGVPPQVAARAGESAARAA